MSVLEVDFEMCDADLGILIVLKWVQVLEGDQRVCNLDVVLVAAAVLITDKLVNLNTLSICWPVRNQATIVMTHREEVTTW